MKQKHWRAPRRLSENDQLMISETWDFTPDAERDPLKITWLEEHRDFMLSCIRRHVASYFFDEDDLLQECYITAWHALDLYERERKNEVKLTTYVWRSCENALKMEMRKIRTAKRSMICANLYEARNEGMEEPVMARDPGLEKQDVYAAMDKVLNEKERKVVTYIMSGLTQVEICAKLRCSQSLVSYILSGARAKLKTELEEN